MRILTLVLCLMGMLTEALAQKPATERPTRFHQLPAIIHCHAGRLDAFFRSAPGETVQVQISEALTIRGTVKNRISKYGTLETAGIQLSEYGQSIFALTRRQTPEGKTVFTGRIIDNRFADGLMLRQRGDEYEFVKVETAHLLPTCDQK